MKNTITITKYELKYLKHLGYDLNDIDENGIIECEISLLNIDFINKCYQSIEYGEEGYEDGLRMLYEEKEIKRMKDLYMKEDSHYLMPEIYRLTNTHDNHEDALYTGYTEEEIENMKKLGITPDIIFQVFWKENKLENYDSLFLDEFVEEEPECYMITIYIPIFVEKEEQPIPIFNPNQLNLFLPKTKETIR